ncbi:MAG TPA: IscS subfamily cysteine desulfurase [Acidobacteriota bacterium]
MAPKLPIYLDYHATTPVDPRALEAMLPFFHQRFGNPASKTHRFGWEADEAVERAREQLAALIGAEPKELIWTSGATESNNLAIQALARCYRQKGNHLVTTAIEHKSVLYAYKRLAEQGYQITVLPVGRDGLLDLEKLRAALTDATILVSVMAANNEIGVLQPLEEISRIVHQRGALLHSDAAQACGKIPLNVRTQGIDLLSFTAHKVYGPKGIGALYARRRGGKPVELVPMLEGGGHERGLRSGTLNVPAIVGAGVAAEIAQQEMAEEGRRLAGLRERLHQKLQAELSGLRLNGHPERRLPGNLSLSFVGVEGEALLMGLHDVALSSGSACTSANPTPSHVLKALGLSDADAHSTLRFGLGRWTTPEEVDYAAERTIEVVRRLRELSAPPPRPAADPKPRWA